jgi:hypothetical protein
VAVKSFVTGEQKLLVEDAADARYVMSGHVVYARVGTLLAQPFDVTRLTVTGKPVGVVEDVMQDVNSPFTIGNSGTAQFSVSSNGTLAYLPGGTAPEGDYVTVWVNRTGVDTEVGIPSRSVAGRPRISPDGLRIALPALEGIGIFDLARQSFQILTSSAWGSRASRSAPERRFVTWHPDGERVTFTGANGDLYWMRADGSGEAQRLTTSDANERSSPQICVPTSWSPDGRILLFTQRLASAASVSRDLWTLTLGDSPPAARPFLVSGSDESSAELSPDGRYLAYESSQSGRSEVYVQPFPGPGRRELVIDRRWWATGVGSQRTRAVLPCVRSGTDDPDDGGGRETGRCVHRRETARPLGGNANTVPWRHRRQNLRRRAGWPALPDDPAERLCAAAARHPCRAGAELAGRARAARADKLEGRDVPR